MRDLQICDRENIVQNMLETKHTGTPRHRNRKYMSHDLMIMKKISRVCENIMLDFATMMRQNCALAVSTMRDFDNSMRDPANMREITLYYYRNSRHIGRPAYRTQRHI